MKNLLEIEDKPEALRNLLLLMRKDNHLLKTFDGAIKNGKISGVYTNLALINGIPISYTKIKGSYNLDKGRLTIKFIPSNLYWLIFTFFTGGIIYFTFQGFTLNPSNFIGSAFFLLFGLMISIASYLDGLSYLKNVTRLHTNLYDKLHSVQ